MSTTRLTLNTKFVFYGLFLFAFVVGAYLRFDITPSPYYFDDQIPFDVISYMEHHHSLDTNWGNVAWKWYLPQYNNQYNFSSYISTLFYIKQLVELVSVIDQPIAFYRLLSLIFQCLTVIVIFYIAYKLKGLFASLAASLFFLLTPMFIIDAHYARPESFLMLLVSLQILLNLLYFNSRNIAFVFFIFFIHGVLVTCKLSMLPLFFINTLLVIYWAKNRLLFFNILGSFFIGSFIFAPYIFLNFSSVLSGYYFLFSQYFSPHVDAYKNLEFLLLPYLFIFIGPFSWLCIFFGFYKSFGATSGDSVPLSSLVKLSLLIVFLYIIFFSLSTFFNESNLSHMAPILSLLFGFGFVDLFSSFNIKLTISRLALLVFILALPLYISFSIVKTIYHHDNPWFNKVERYERALLEQYQSDSFISESELLHLLSKNPDLKFQTASIIKISWVNRPPHQQLLKQLGSLGYKNIGEIRSPLAYLPHSQLESLHLPESYRYLYKPPN